MVKQAHKNIHPPVKKKTLKKKALRRDRLEARIAKEQKSLFQKAADLQGRSLSDFIIHSAQQEALKTIQEYESMSLGYEDQRILMDALFNYEVPNKALRLAAKQYFQMQL